VAAIGSAPLFAVPRPALLPGRAVHRPARVPSAGMSLASPTTVRGVNGWRCAPDEETQRRVVGALLRPLGQDARMNGAEHGASARVDHDHHNLGSAGRVEHDPVAHGPTAGDVHQLAGLRCIHRHTVLRPALASSPSRRDGGSIDRGSHRRPVIFQLPITTALLRRVSLGRRFPPRLRFGAQLGLQLAVVNEVLLAPLR